MKKLILLIVLFASCEPEQYNNTRNYKYCIRQDGYLMHSDSIIHINSNSIILIDENGSKIIVNGNYTLYEYK
jgi:hypothetical protein